MCKQYLSLKEPGVPQKVNHSIKGEDRDEGKVQEYRVKTVKLGGEIQHLFVSMWAVNKVLQYIELSVRKAKIL